MAAIYDRSCFCSIENVVESRRVSLTDREPTQTLNSKLSATYKEESRQDSGKLPPLETMSSPWEKSVSIQHEKETIAKPFIYRKTNFGPDFYHTHHFDHQFSFGNSIFLSIMSPVMKSPLLHINLYHSMEKVIAEYILFLLFSSQPSFSSHLSLILLSITWILCKIRTLDGFEKQSRGS